MSRAEATWRLGHRPALDGLRGVAILLVLADHTGFLPGPVGAIGVTVFFVLSGFLISRVIIEARADGRWSFPRFFGNRVVRLAPALVLMVAVVTLWWILLDRSPTEITKLALLAVTYTQNLAHGLPDMAWTPFDHTWSLATEEQFYLLWPWIVPFLLRVRRPLAWIGVGVLASVVFRIGTAQLGYVDEGYANLPGNAYAMLLGCGLAIAVRNLPAVRNLWVLPAALAGLPITLGASRFISLPEIYAPLVAALLSGLLLWSSLNGSRLLELAPLRFFGRISYSLYLWHFPLLVIPGVERGRIDAVPVTLLALALATASTLWFEEPVRRWWRTRALTSAVEPRDLPVVAARGGSRG